MNDADEWEPLFTYEEVTDGLPIGAAIMLGIVCVSTFCLLGVLLGLVILAL